MIPRAAFREWVDMLTALALVSLPAQLLYHCPGELGRRARRFMDTPFTDPRKTWAGRTP